jgi:hypothetical protein
LESFKTVLKSIDVRTVAVKHCQNEEWQNLITVISISEKSINDIAKKQTKIAQVSNNEFTILTLALPFDYSFFELIAQGSMTFKKPEEIINVAIRAFDPLSLKVSASGIYPGNFLNATAQGKEVERRRLWEIVCNQQQEAKRKGFLDIWELLRNALGIVYGQNDQKDFELNIPSFAHIQKAAFKDKKFEVRLNKPANVSGLQLNVTLKNTYTHPAKVLWNATKEVKGNNYFFQPSNLVPFDIMNVELIHEESALAFDDMTVGVPLANAAEPILTTLNNFCPLVELKRMLNEPQLCGDKPDKIFETAIAWLLSMCGFTTLHLGIEIKMKNQTKKKTDVFRIPDNNYQVGTADIIAYNNADKLFLIDCDLKGNDNKKVKDLLEIQKYYQGVFKEYEKLKIIPVLCTPREINDFNQEGVHLLGNYRIKQMFEEIMRGNKEKARFELNYVF